VRVAFEVPGVVAVAVGAGALERRDERAGGVEDAPELFERARSVLAWDVQEARARPDAVERARLEGERPHVGADERCVDGVASALEEGGGEVDADDVVPACRERRGVRPGPAADVEDSRAGERGVDVVPEAGGDGFGLVLLDERVRVAFVRPHRPRELVHAALFAELAYESSGRDGAGQHGAVAEPTDAARSLCGRDAVAVRSTLDRTNHRSKVARTVTFWPSFCERRPRPALRAGRTAVARQKVVASWLRGVSPLLFGPAFG